MDATTSLTDAEKVEIYSAALNEVYADGAPYDGPDRVNKLAQEKAEHLLRMKDLRRRVTLEMQSNIW